MQDLPLGRFFLMVGGKAFWQLVESQQSTRILRLYTRDRPFLGAIMNRAGGLNDLYSSDFSGRSKGNRMTSRMERESVSSMVSRSMPMPSPPVGGMP